MIVALWLSLGMLLAGIFLAFGRLVRGPRVADRVVALDVVTSLAVGLMALLAVHLDQPMFLDAAVVVALIAFLGTVAFAQYITRQAGR